MLVKGNPSRKGKITKTEMNRSKKKGADLRTGAKHSRKKAMQKSRSDTGELVSDAELCLGFGCDSVCSFYLLL
ncbi:unnamed protein product [Camellia sinensis]